MRDPDGKFFCDYCGRRSALGGFNFTVRGKPHIKRLALGPDALYCSERCIRNHTLGINGTWGTTDDEEGTEPDPVDVLGRRVVKLEKLLHEEQQLRREEYENAPAEPLAENERDDFNLLRSMTKNVVAAVQDENLRDAIDTTTEKGARLSQLLDSLESLHKKRQQFGWL